MLTKLLYEFVMRKWKYHIENVTVLYLYFSYITTLAPHHTSTVYLYLPYTPNIIHQYILYINTIQGRFGMQRSPSMEFKDLTKKDAQISLAMELDKLTMTSPTGAREEVEQNFDGFKRLFGKFITSSGPSVRWEKIEKLPPNAVSWLWVWGRE